MALLTRRLKGVTFSRLFSDRQKSPMALLTRRLKGVTFSLLALALFAAPAVSREREHLQVS